MLCTVFNNSICCHGELIKKCSLWKESKIKWLIYEPVPLCLCHPSSLNAWLSCLSCFITHTPSCCVPYCDWPLSRDTRLTHNGRLTGAQSSSWLHWALFSLWRLTSSAGPRAAGSLLLFVFEVLNAAASVLHLVWGHANHKRNWGIISQMASSTKTTIALAQSSLPPLPTIILHFLCFCLL